MSGDLNLPWFGAGSSVDWNPATYGGNLPAVQQLQSVLGPRSNQDGPLAPINPDRAFVQIPMPIPRPSDAESGAPVQTGSQMFNRMMNNVTGLGTGDQSVTGGVGAVVSQYFLRGIVVVLGFIFVAMGLRQFTNSNS